VVAAVLSCCGWPFPAAAQRVPVHAPARAPAAYRFRTERGWLRMPDGVRLAVTYWRPIPRRQGERFPVLLEYLPYRKEDSFYQRDFPIYSWFVRRGFILAAVDLRGTGSSEGMVPPREYSDEEMLDADEIIAQLARMPESNGRVGMWGISWGGFNSIQVAMRRPPALKAILAIAATDDLYHDDIHYIDGVLHVDQYALEIDHENGLPAAPEYRTDSAYFHDRFDRSPWILTYLKHPVDDEWWRQKSLRFHYGAIAVPCFLIGGQLDGYRDAVPRMLDSVRAPVKALMGPWKHDFPHNASPGPRYEWREQAVRWWNHWLRGVENGIMDEPRLTLFVRAGHPPDAAMTTTPGRWRFEDWPITRTRWRAWYPAADHRLTSRPDTVSRAAGGDQLRYVAGTGTGVPVWWNDPTGNMAADDRASLSYDAPVLRHTVEIVGLPRVRLLVSAPAPVADWTVRLEDVGPDGRVSLVTGALISGAQRDSRTSPSPLVPGVEYQLAAELHFTTWTFRPGHRIRLAVANAQFPMAWPTPYPMTTRLTTGAAGTVLELPVTPALPHARRPPALPPVPGADAEAPDARTLSYHATPGGKVTRDTSTKTTMVDFETRWDYMIGARIVQTVEREHYQTEDESPARSSFLGNEVHRFTFAGGRTVRVHTIMEIRSDQTELHVTVTRRLYERERLIRSRSWNETLPRGIH
jgi:putative CocE/NonD family hydrolase